MSLTPNVAWSELTPAGGDQINAGDNRLREMKTQIREVIDVDHDFPSSGQAADVGQHKRVTLQEQADLGTGAEGVPILGAQTINDKPELVYTDEDDNDIQITKAGEINVEAISDAVKTTPLYIAIANLLYPVGKVVTLGVSTNPGTLFGVGTWTAIAGRVIVGISASDTEFDTLNETGGAKSVTLTGAQSGLPAHNHPLPVYGRDGVGNYAAHSDGGNGGYTANTSNCSAANASEAHTNLQPYIVKYVWERTA